MAINVKKKLKALKKQKRYKNIGMIADDLGLSEGYLNSILSLKSQKVPFIPLLEQISIKSGKEFKSFFDDINNFGI